MVVVLNNAAHVPPGQIWAVSGAGLAVCSDDLVIIHADWDWQEVERVLCEDMAAASEYLQTWKL